MPQLKCPKCGAPVTFYRDAGGMPCCFQCGWRLDEVRQTKARLIRGLCWAYALLLLVAVVVGFQEGQDEGEALAVAFTVIIGIAFLGTWWDVRRLTAASASAAAPASRQVAANRSSSRASFGIQAGVASGQVATQQEIPGALASIARPRPVRLKLSAKIIGAANLALVVGLALYSWYVLAHSSASPRTNYPNYPWLVPVTLVFALLSVTFLWRQAQKENTVRRLLVDGEIAMACVISRRLGPEGSGFESGARRPVIGYEFQSAQGEKMYGESKDYSNKYFEDMYVPVFYDPQTRESVAICGSYYEVILPG